MLTAHFALLILRPCSTHKLGNRHAQFLLDVRCPSADVGMSPDPDKADVVFRDWEAVLAAAKLAVLRAWRPALSLALLKQLEQLEGSEAQATPSAPTAAEAGGPGGFHEWVARQTGEEQALAALLESRAQPAQGPAAPIHGRDAGMQQGCAGPASGGAARGRWSGGSVGQQRPSGGIKHSLVSRLVRFTGAEDRQPSSVPQEAPPQPGGSDSGERQAKRPRAEVVAAGQPFGGEALADGACEMDSLEPSSGQPQQDLREEGAPPARLGGGQLSPGASENDPLAAWHPLPASHFGPISSTAAASGPGTLPALPQPSITAAERRMLAAMAWAHASPGSSRRSRSAPPHARQCSGVVRARRTKNLRAPALAAAGAGGQRGLQGRDEGSPETSQLGPGPAALGLGGAGSGGRGLVSWRQQRADRPAAADAHAGKQRVGSGWGLAHTATRAGQPDGPTSHAAAAAEDRQPSRFAVPRSGSPPVGDGRAGSAGQRPALLPFPPALPPQPAAPAQPAAFLQPDPGIEGLLSSWRSPAAPVLGHQGRGSAEGVLQLEALEKDLFAQLRPAGLSREQLQAWRALCQVDAKFIPVVCGQLVAIIDQHAAGGREKGPGVDGTCPAVQWQPDAPHVSELKAGQGTAGATCVWRMRTPRTSPALHAQTSGCSWSTCAGSLWAAAASRCGASPWR